jgi:hypothetical protein
MELKLCCQKLKVIERLRQAGKIDYGKYRYLIDAAMKTYIQSLADVAIKRYGEKS